MRRTFRKDTLGSFAVTTAILLPVIFGLTGIAVEIGSWYVKRRAMQGAADAAAYSAAIAYTMGSSWQTEGQGVAAANGFSNGVNGITVTVNSPPASGSYSKGKAFEVIITQPVAPTFSTLLGLTTGPTIPARAVAELAGGTASDCVLGLDRSASGTITLKGGTSLTMPNCGIGDNSKSSSALAMSGTGNSIQAGSITVVGGESLSGSPSISPAPQTNASPIANPYGGLTVPTFSDPSNCKKNGGITINAGQTVTLDSAVSGNSSPPYNSGQTITLIWPPGGVNSGSTQAMVICGNISVTGNGSLNLNPGVYILDGGSLSANNGFITGSGVTIIFTSTGSANNIGTAQLSGSVQVQLTANASGPFPGFVFFQDPNAASAKSPPNASIGGTASSYINGALYFPAAGVTFSGNSKGCLGGSACNSSTGCTQIIADTIQFSGNVSITNAGCSNLNLKPIGPTRLVA